MSFILDALKKSEGQRQRQSGPALFEVRLAPPRTRIPAWAVGVGALLLVNLAAFGWMMLRTPSPSPPPGSMEAPTVDAATVVGEQQPIVSPPVIAAGVPPSQPAIEEDFEPQLVGDETELPASDDAPSSIFDEPAVALADRSARVTRGTVLGVPTYEQLLARPGPAMPDLRLDLHVFANDPAVRFIFLNNRRLAEGEALPDGTRVESIVPDGAVLSVGGTRFLLQRQ